MVLNNLSQSFVIYFPQNFFYPDVNDNWLPLIKRMYLPYRTTEDFMNAQIQTISFPSIAAPAVTQGRWQYEIHKRNGKELDQLFPKEPINITFKLTESYMSYFIIREQFDLFLKYFNIQPLYWAPITVSLLDDAGMETISYRFVQITPTNLSDMSLSYAARLGTYNTFSLGFHYNYFEIWYRDPETGKLQLHHKYDMVREKNQKDMIIQSRNNINNKLSVYDQNHK